MFIYYFNYIYFLEIKSKNKLLNLNDVIILNNIWLVFKIPGLKDYIKWAQLALKNWFFIFAMNLQARR